MFEKNTMICNISNEQQLRYNLNSKVDVINFYEYDLMRNIKEL